MIQFDKDGVTLVGYTADGTRFSRNYSEGDDYSKMEATRAAQLAAGRDNVQAVSSYNTLLSEFQTALDTGRPHDAAPVKPLQRVVDDLGNVTFVPFVPPLADPNYPKITPSGQIKADTPDKQAIMYNMILALFRKAFPDA